MSFPHEIVLERATLEGVSYETPNGEILTAPTLSGTLSADGEDANLTWTKPDTEVPIMSYEVIVDGSVHTNVLEREYQYQDLTYNQLYDFQVRAIGPMGLKGPISNTVTLEGGGQPDLTTHAVGEYKGGSIAWNNLVGESPDYTIEGYNVYYAAGHDEGAASWAKLNNSQLATSFTSFAYIGLADDFDFMLGVTYLYNSGQESKKYINKITTMPPNPYYVASLWRGVLVANDKHDLKMRNPDIYKGIQVSDTAEVRVTEFSPGSAIDRYIWVQDWLGIYFNDPVKVAWWLESHNQYQELEYEMNENGDCDNGIQPDSWKYVRGNLTYIEEKGFADEGYIKAGWYHDPEKTMYGPRCASNTKSYFLIQVSQGDIVDEFNLNDKGYQLIKKDPTKPRLQVTTDPSFPDIREFEIKTHKGFPHHNLYIKDKGGSYGTRYGGDIVEFDALGKLSIDVSGMTVGDKVAKIEYLYMDESSSGEETNEVEFTV